MRTSLKQYIKPALWLTCIIASLLVILFLPLFIWSPIGSKFGYYDYPSPKLMYQFAQVSEKQAVIFERVTSMSTKKHVYYFTTLDYGPNNTYMSKANPTLRWDNDKLICHSMLGKQILMKITNPITIWHIKWIEWTH